MSLNLLVYTLRQHSFPAFCSKLSAGACILFSFTSLAQQKDSLKTLSLAPVTVTTTRLETNEKRLPAALTVLDGSRIQIGQPQLSLFESLGGVAGLFAQNPDNFNQDLRISIRGFGAGRLLGFVAFGWW